jgi:hypothetical protein
MSFFEGVQEFLGMNVPVPMILLIPSVIGFIFLSPYRSLCFGTIKINTTESNGYNRIVHMEGLHVYDPGCLEDFEPLEDNSKVEPEKHPDVNIITSVNLTETKTETETKTDDETETETNDET